MGPGGRAGGESAPGGGPTFARVGAKGTDGRGGGPGPPARRADAPGDGAQSKEPLGFVLRPRDDFAELEIDPGSRAGAGLPHFARIDASAEYEPLRAVLGRGGKGLPGLSRGGGLVEEPFRRSGVLTAPYSSACAS